MNLRIECAPVAAVDNRDDHCLANVVIADQAAPQVWKLPLQALADKLMHERWRLDEPVAASTVSAEHWQLQHRYSPHLAMSWLQFDVSSHSDTAAATHWAYTELLSHLATSNHQQLLKIWHYLPAINAGEGDRENYRQFCVGRAQALRDHNITSTMPAATAIGIPLATLADQPGANEQGHGKRQAVFYWLSGTMSPDNVENPRQISAWQYPPQYGPASPMFSRASVLHLGEQRLLLISGTASVTGHATAYPGDCAAQTDEMLLNLRSLVDASSMPYAPERMLLRVYLRHPDDWPLVQTRMQQAGFNSAQLVPLHGDICRSDLLVELDGVLLEA
jgi:chorismate lyase/3-hydroxybenzoate synthase